MAVAGRGPVAAIVHSLPSLHQPHGEHDADVPAAIQWVGPCVVARAADEGRVDNLLHRAWVSSWQVHASACLDTQQEGGGDDYNWSLLLEMQAERGQREVSVLQHESISHAVL